jgi:hypothetical protein
LQRLRHLKQLGGVSRVFPGEPESPFAAVNGRP